MTMRWAPAAATLALLAGQAGQAGQNPVTNVPAVFVPPIVLSSPSVPGDLEAGGIAAGRPGAGDVGAGGAGAGGTGAGGAAADGTAVDGEAATADVTPAAADAEGEGEGEAESSVIADAATRITQVTELCRGLPDRAYTVDCIAAGLAEIAAAMPETGDAAAARAALTEAAEDLRELAQANRSRSLPRVNIQRGDVAVSRPVVPVVPSPEVDAAAAAIVAQAQTMLLRSAPASASDDYSRISASLDTTRILLRSG